MEPTDPVQEMGTELGRKNLALLWLFFFASPVES